MKDNTITTNGGFMNKNDAVIEKVLLKELINSIALQEMIEEIWTNEKLNSKKYESTKYVLYDQIAICSSKLLKEMLSIIDKIENSELDEANKDFLRMKDRVLEI